MDVTWQMQCDANHRWKVTLPAAHEPTAEVMRCECGQEAVVVSPEPSADRVDFSLRQRARIDDPVKQSIVDEGIVALTVIARDGARRELEPMAMDKALRVIREIHACSTDEAWRKLERMGLSPASGDDPAADGNSPERTAIERTLWMWGIRGDSCAVLAHLVLEALAEARGESSDEA